MPQHYSSLFQVGFMITKDPTETCRGAAISVLESIQASMTAYLLELKPLNIQKASQVKCILNCYFFGWSCGYAHYNRPLGGWYGELAQPYPPTYCTCNCKCNTDVWWSYVYVVVPRKSTRYCIVVWSSVILILLEKESLWWWHVVVFPEKLNKAIQCNGGVIDQGTKDSVVSCEICSIPMDRPSIQGFAIIDNSIHDALLLYFYLYILFGRQHIYICKCEGPVYVIWI